MSRFFIPLLLATLVPLFPVSAERNPFGSTVNGPTRDQIIPLRLQDIKKPAISPRDDGTFLLTADQVQLQGDAVIEHQYGFSSIGYFRKRGHQAAWKLNVPKDGTYIIEVQYSCPQSTKAPASLADIRSGNSICPWNVVLTGGSWQHFTRRHIGKIQLSAGEQPFILTHLIDGYLLNIGYFRLIPDPGLEIKPNKMGSFLLLPDTADLTNAAWNSKNIIDAIGSVSWRINSPILQRYSLIVKAATSRDVDIELSCGSMVSTVSIPSTGGHNNFPEQTIATVTIPAGSSIISLKTKNGVFDIQAVTLQPTGENMDAKIKELEAKPRIGMNKEALDLLWGGSVAKGSQDFLKLHGINEAETDFYKGIELSCKAYQWTLPDMTVTGVFMDGKCINLIVKMPNQTFAASKTLLAKLLPGVAFASAPTTTEPPYIVPSKDNTYQFLYWGDCFELRAPNIVNEARESAEKEFKNTIGKVRLGMSLSQLKEILGEGRPRSDFDAERSGPGDIDQNLYKGITKRCNGNIWGYPEKKDFYITAILFQDKCIEFDISQRGGFTTEEALSLAQTFIPGVQFNVTPARMQPQYAYYSTNYGKGYKMQYRGAFLELKASALLKALLLEELGIVSKKPVLPGATDSSASPSLKQSSLALTNLLQKSPLLKNTPIFGKSAEAVDSILGKSEEIDPSLTIQPTRVWKIKNSTFRLTGTFSKKNGKDILNSISIVDESGAITPAVALFVARKLIAPYTTPPISSAQMNAAFTLTSSDPQQRFTLEWIPDKNNSGIMRIADKD